jgi:hypothetical protein
MKSSTLSVVILAVALAASIGCMRRPNIFSPPGSTTYQRYHATIHDPYPDHDLGPEIVGGRPREFDKPHPEPIRNRWLSDSWWTQH